MKRKSGANGHPTKVTRIRLDHLAIIDENGWDIFDIVVLGIEAQKAREGIA